MVQVQQHSGVLRAKITPLGGRAVKVEWFDPATLAVVWTETCDPADGMSFVSQIQCEGDFRTVSGFFIDGEGKRHFVMHADPGRLGATMSK